MKIFLLHLLRTLEFLFSMRDPRNIKVWTPGEKFSKLVWDEVTKKFHPNNLYYTWVVHYSASNDPLDWSYERVRDLHLAPLGAMVNWNGESFIKEKPMFQAKDYIGYTAVIERDGTVIMGRPPWLTQAHCKGHNNFMGVLLQGKDHFTRDQLKSLRNFLVKVKPKAVVPHNFLDPKKGLCPNLGFKEGNEIYRGFQHFEDKPKYKYPKGAEIVR